MNRGEEDKSLEWVVYDTLEEENKKLKGRIKALEAKNAKLREAAEDAYDWAILHKTEMKRGGVWDRLKKEVGKP